jgi:hypothetical protein
MSIFCYRTLGQATKSKYIGNLRMLNHFLIMLGDYESMLILQDNAPDDCISMDVDSLILFARYKCGENGTPLTDLNGKDINDADGNVIQCTNDWKDPNNMNASHSAIHLLHDSHGHCGQYEDHCQKCLALAPADQYKGCHNSLKDSKTNSQGQSHHQSTMEELCARL